MKIVAKVAVIGAGYWGKNLVRNFAELGALHSVCDSSTEELNKSKALYPWINTESDYHNLLTNKEIEGIVVAAPAALHYSIARSVIMAGKDVFVEKPLALKVKEGKELVKLAEKQKRILMVGHLLEYHPGVVKLKAMVDNGKLGRLKYIYSTRLNFGKFRTEEDVLWSFAPHDISVILLLTGALPDRVSAEGSSYLNKGIYDVATATLSFPGGIKAYIFVSWLNPYKEQRLVVVGEKGMALFDDTQQVNKLTFYGHTIEWKEGKPVPHPANPEVVSLPFEEPLKVECQEFLECVQSRNQPRTTGHKGVQVLEVLSSCQQRLQRE